MPTTTTSPPDALVTRLHDDYAPALLNYLHRLTGDRHRSEDLVQETLLRAWLRAGTLREEEHQIRAWLFRVAHNVAVDDLRRRARPGETVGDPHHYATSADPSESLLTRLDVVRALATLSPEHRTVLIEIFYCGRTTREAARVLHIPHGTAKSRLHYGLRSLRSTMYGGVARAA